MIIEAQFPPPEFSIWTVILLQIRRRVKQVPLAFYNATPASLFSESDFPGRTFKFKENDES